MRTRNFFLTALLAGCILRAHAQGPIAWTATPGLFEYSNFTYVGQSTLKMVTASDGSIIAGGGYTDSSLYSYPLNPAARVHVHKYSNTGTLLAEYIDADPDWVQVDGVYPSGLNDYVFDMIIDADDNVYFLESQSDTVHVGATLYKGIRGIVKLDANMNLLWKTFSPENDWLSMSFDASGNIIVNGTTKNNGDGTATNIVTAQYTPDGNNVWTKTFSSDGSYYDRGNDVTADALGNIYITGSVGTATSGLSSVTMKYDADGNVVWSKMYDYNALTTATDQGGSIIASATGNVYVGAVSGITGGFSRATILAYDTDGNSRWVRAYHDHGKYSQLYTVKIRMDASENVYLGCLVYTQRGFTIYNDQNYSMLLYQCTSKGQSGWRIQKKVAYLTDFDVTPDGEMYVTGSEGISAQMYVARYDGTGNLVWEDTYTPAIIENQTWSYSQAACLSINPNNPDEVTVAGNAYLQNSSGIYFTTGVVRHFDGPLKLSGDNLSSENLNDLSLQSFPNPANNETTVNFSLAEASQVSIALYDLSGRLMKSPLVFSAISGVNQLTISTEDLPAGVYVCKVNGDGVSSSLKITVAH